MVLRIFEHLHKKNPDTLLLLVGDGPMKEKCIQLSKELKINDSVVFFGKTNKVNQLMSSADCMLFPSRYEGFPNVLLEVQTNGLPIVFSDVITKEIEITDLCVPLSISDDIEVWADTVLEQLSIQRNRSKYCDIIDNLGFSSEKEIERLEKYYNEIIHNKN